MSKKPFVSIENSLEHKKSLFAIALILVMAISATAVILPSVSAHTPAWTIPTYAYVTAAPNPVGVGQTVAVVFWLDIPPPTASSPYAGDRWRGETITITKPDGTIVSKGPYVSDALGSAYMLYVPDKIGTYNVTFSFPGQVLGTVHPVTGQVGNTNNVYINDTYSASTATTTFTVQQNAISYFQEAPFPVSYFTRPINENNQQWASIASNWLGQQEYGATINKYQPYGWAPNTAHVVWTYPLSWGGIVGGKNAISEMMSFYSGTQYQLKFANPIIMYGIVYFSLPVNNAPSGNGITAVDLRTGKTLWTNEAINSVSIGQFYDYESPNQHGTTGMYLWTSGTISGTSIRNPSTAASAKLNGTYAANSDIGSSTKSGAFTASGLMAIDPQTGHVLFNQTDMPSTFGGTLRAYGPQGEWLYYSIGRVNSSRSAAQGNNEPFTYLWELNNTKLPGGGDWSPNGNNYNMSASYDWNVTLSQPLYPTFTSIGSYGGGFSGSAYYNATTGLYTNNPQIMRVFPGNLILGQSSGLQQTPGTSYAVFGTPTTYELWAINLNKTRGPIGTVMWDKTYNAPDGNLTVNLGPGDGETNVFTTWFKETMQWTGFDMLTGNQIWGPTASEQAWNFYTGSTGLTNPVGVGYGHLYAAGYSGTLYAYNLKTGNLDFTYGNNASDPFNSTITPETVYGNYPTQVAAVANNKVYLVEEEHSLNAPAYHGAMTRCVDAFTGKELWKIYGISSWQMQAVADGYYTWLNLNDMQIYATGPGPSSTTVTANPGVISNGGGVEIIGTVLDQSPNIKLKGTPAISDRDQGPWMEYMIQSSIAKPYVNGVPVQLTAIDKDGKAIDLGTVTSDSEGTFHKLWTPPAEGEYAIYANFIGSDSYGPSSASTAVGVMPAASPAVPTTVPPTIAPPTVTPTPTPSPSTPENPTGGPNTALYAGIAAVVIIVVVAAVAVMLRRRK